MSKAYRKKKAKNVVLKGRIVANSFKENFTTNPRFVEIL